MGEFALCLHAKTKRTLLPSPFLLLLRIEECGAAEAAYTTVGIGRRRADRRNLMFHTTVFFSRKKTFSADRKCVPPPPFFSEDI